MLVARAVSRRGARSELVELCCWPCRPELPEKKVSSSTFGGREILGLDAPQWPCHNRAANLSEQAIPQIREWQGRDTKTSFVTIRL